jgi:serine/threonine protein kinase
MNTLFGAINLCATIYDMHGKFTSNKQLCERLVGQAGRIATELKRLLDSGAVPIDLDLELVDLIGDLQGSVLVLQDYGHCSGVKRWVFGSKHASQFKEHYDRLHMSYVHLCLTLLVDRRDSERGLQTFEEAFQLDVKEYEQAYGDALQNGELSAAVLEGVGVSPRDLERQRSFSVLAPAAGAAVISTMEQAQSCSWIMRTKELQMDKKGESANNVRLGQPGSFGDVYSAMHFGTPVAVKKLRSPCSAQDLSSSKPAARAAFAAFVTEVSFAFSLKHPNIVRTLGGIVDAREEPPCWIVMERLQCSLADMDADASGKLKLDDHQKLDIIMGVCSALVYLHSSNRNDSESTEAHAHCDLKPENIMYQDGVAKLIDFGIAKVSIRSTHGSSVKGTRNWMSPEQGISKVKKTYTQCDMFSFGLIVKWLLVGARDDIPFKDAEFDDISVEHRNLHSSAGSMVHPYIQDLSLVPPIFRTLIQCCAATDTKKRWTAKKAMLELYNFKSRLPAQPMHRQPEPTVPLHHPPRLGNRQSSPPPQSGHHDPSSLRLDGYHPSPPSLRLDGYHPSHLPQVGHRQSSPPPQIKHQQPPPPHLVEHHYQQDLVTLSAALEQFQVVPAPETVAASGSYLGPAALTAGDGAVHAPVAAVSSENWQSLLQDLQGALAPEAVASVKYYRDVAFAAALCGAYSNDEADEQKLSNAAQYAAASQKLHKIAADQCSPTYADKLAALLAQARLADPQIEAAQNKAKKDQGYSNAAELKLRADLLALIPQADALLREQPGWPPVTALQRFSLRLQRLTTTGKIFKKWVPHHFVLSNGRLYHSDGHHEGHPDSREGTLSFVSSDPPSSRRHCLVLKGCTVTPRSAAVDGQHFAFDVKFPTGSEHKDVCLAADRDVTRQRCMRIIEAASAGGASSSLPDIALYAALTPVLFMRRVRAVNAVLAALDRRSVGELNALSFKEAGLDAAICRAAGCDWSTIRTVGFSAAEVKAAGCDLASAKAAGYDHVPSLVVAYGYDAVAAAKIDLSSYTYESVSFLPCSCRACSN